jgi:hypothetical protein
MFKLYYVSDNLDLGDLYLTLYQNVKNYIYIYI